MFQTKLIAPFLLALCIGFIFACQKEEQTSATQEQSNAVNSTQQADDRDDCCNVAFNTFQANNGSLFAYFNLRVFPGAQYRFIVTKVSTGQTFTTGWTSVSGTPNMCQSPLVKHNLTNTVISQFGNCNAMYTVTCEIRTLSLQCHETAVSPAQPSGKLLCE